MAWKKSSYSLGNGACVEVDAPEWRKSSYSVLNGACTEVAAVPTADDYMIAVRDSKNPDAGHLTFTPAEWDTFLTAIKWAMNQGGQDG